MTNKCEHIHSLKMDAKNGHRLRILATVGNYLPGYKAGGQLRTVSNMVDALGDEFEFRIITSDRDLGDYKPYDGITTNQWTRVGKAEVYYVKDGRYTLKDCAKLLDSTPHDILYLNSFFSPEFTIKPLLALRRGLSRRTPVVIAPRGEFSTGAFKLKTFKKRCYLEAYKALLHKEPVLFQASSDLEAADIKKFIKRAKTYIAPDIAKFYSLRPQEQLGDESLEKIPEICFISRVSPMKNLLYALKALQGVTKEVTFNIYGPLEDQGYWEECQQAMKSLPKNVQARHCGQLKHEEVPATFSSHDLFLFPTRGENYGHVISEALLNGTPAMISDQTPWNDLEKEGAGWVLPLENIDLWTQEIDEFLSTPAKERNAYRHRARKFGESVVRDPATLNANRQLFKQALTM